MLAVHSVSKRFGRLQAVRDVSFQLRKGEVVGLLGPNGAGKTTTIRMISGYLPPDSGRVEVAGHDALSDSLAARKCLGYLPESAPLYGEMKTADYLHYRARLFEIPRARRAAAVDQALERCWLRDVRQRRVGKLSKGYKQRVGLAAALLHNPSLLILDEPTNGLDPTQIRETRSLIRELAADRTVLLSSHVLPEVELTCDRVIIIGLGRLRADANLADLIGRNAHPTVIAEVAGPSPGLGTEVVRRALAAAEGAGRVELDPLQPADATAGWARWRITPAPGAHDLREPIARAAAAAGLLVRELRREAPTLEKLFATLINTPLPDSPLPVSTTTPGGAA